MVFPYINIHTHSSPQGALCASSAGIHPWDAESFFPLEAEQRRKLEEAITSTQMVGEIGLDFAADVDRKAQESVFDAQLRLAKKHNKVVILHCVKAFEATMKCLSTFPLRGVIFHGFIGSVQQMNQAIERGYYISFGDRTFASPKSLKALRECPIELLLLETDTSDISIEELYEKISKYRMESVDELREALYNNFHRLF